MYLIQGPPSKKNSTSLSVLVKSLMSFSISGKLRCGVGVNFKPLHGRPIFTENLSITAKPEKIHLYVCHTSCPTKHEKCWLFLLQRQRFQNKIMKEITIAQNIAFKMRNNNFTLCTRRTTEWIIAIWQFLSFSQFRFKEIMDRRVTQGNLIITHLYQMLNSAFQICLMNPNTRY